MLKQRENKHILLMVVIHISLCEYSLLLSIPSPSPSPSLYLAPTQQPSFSFTMFLYTASNSLWYFRRDPITTGLTGITGYPREDRMENDIMKTVATGFQVRCYETLSYVG